MKFRRKSSADEADDLAQLDDELEETEESAEEPASGPFDADDLPEDGVKRVDLGSLLIEPKPGHDLRLQVDEASGNVQLGRPRGKDGAIELRAFAAPRNGDLWSEVRPQIAADMAQKGGTATEREGRSVPSWSATCRSSARAAAAPTNQPSRIVGINGPRWLLRATFFGRPAAEPDKAGEWEDAITRIAVRRGDQAMPVGEPLKVTMPEQARRAGPPTA